ncbi:MAG: hypothetical protein GX556_00680 [Fibrobacter sp.]|nr:hypothetical protein [Fibrobacter sp.]
MATGTDQLWYVPCKNAIMQCGVIKIKATGEKKNKLEQTAIFVPEEPKIFVKYHTELNDSLLVFETEQLDTVHLRIGGR